MDCSSKLGACSKRRTSSRVMHLNWTIHLQEETPAARIDLPFEMKHQALCFACVEFRAEATGAQPHT